MKATKTRGLGKQYVQLLWGFRGPVREAGWTNETEAPYRYGHCHVWRLWPLRAAVVHGKWLGSHPGPQQLHDLLDAPCLDIDDLDYYDPLENAVSRLPQ